MKTCNRCKRQKPLTEFYFAYRQMSYKGNCKECDRSYRKNWQKENPLKVAQYAIKSRATKRYRDKNPEKTREKHRRASAKYRKRHPQRAHARQVVSNGRANGTIIQKPCHSCGDINSEAHHPDYSKPLNFIWFCPACHQAEHRLIEATADDL